VTPAVVDSNRLLKTLDGTRSVGFWTTGLVGSNQAVSLIRRVSPRWFTKPQTSSMTIFYRPDLGRQSFTIVPPGANPSNETTGPTVQINRGRFDFLSRAQWHRFVCSWTAGTWEAAGLNIELKQAGQE
jgi:hypothetical protein